MFRIGQANDPYCLWCLDHNIPLIADVDHFFCNCPHVSRIFSTIKTLALRLLGNVTVSSSDLVRLRIPMNRCPRAVWLIGAYVSAVWNSRNEEIGVCQAEFFGFLKFKFRLGNLGTSEQADIVCQVLA